VHIVARCRHNGRAPLSDGDLEGSQRMEERSRLSIASLVVFALLYFLLVNAFAIGWYVLDFKAPHGAGGASILDLDGHSKFRNFWEIVSYISSSVVVLVAALAFFVARHQLRSAEHVRLASVYMDISKRWSSAELVRSRALITALSEFYDRRRADPAFAAYAARGDYIKAVLLDLLAGDKVRLHEYIVIAAFFEDVGVLCRRDYVRADDLFDFLGGPIERYLEDLLPFILAVRGDGEKGRAIYANALWLYRAVKRRRLFEDSGEGLIAAPGRPAA
jgi:hypothetical protein